MSREGHVFLSFSLCVLARPLCCPHPGPFVGGGLGKLLPCFRVPLSSPVLVAWPCCGACPRPVQSPLGPKGQEKAWGRKGQEALGEWNFRNGRSGRAPAGSGCLGLCSGNFVLPFGWPFHRPPPSFEFQFSFFPEGLFYCTLKFSFCLAQSTDSCC